LWKLSIRGDHNDNLEYVEYVDDVEEQTNRAAVKQLIQEMGLDAAIKTQQANLDDMDKGMSMVPPMLRPVLEKQRRRTAIWIEMLQEEKREQEKEKQQERLEQLEKLVLKQQERLEQLEQDGKKKKKKKWYQRLLGL